MKGFMKKVEEYVQEHALSNKHDRNKITSHVWRKKYMIFVCYEK